jgi:hypothetical protein
MKVGVFGHLLFNLVVGLGYLHAFVFVQDLLAGCLRVSILSGVFLFVLLLSFVHSLCFLFLSMGLFLLLAVVIIGANLCIERIIIIKLIVLINEAVLLGVGYCIWVEHVHAFLDFAEQEGAVVKVELSHVRACVTED